jgi:hypothetical protein
MAALAVLAAGAEVEVRVKPGSAGAPQIHVDGKAVPARMFWGWRGHRPIIVGTAWERFELAFTPKAADPGTIHFRIPSDRALVVFLRNVRVVDTVTGADYLDPASLSSAEAFAKAWTVFDNDTLGHADVTADGCLKIEGWGKNKGSKPNPHFHCYTKRTPFVEGRRYVLSFEAKASEDDVYLIPAAYTCYAGNYTRWPFTGRDPFPVQVKMAADAGVDLVSFMAPKTIWKDDDTYDWADLDDLCDEVIAINPKALLVPRIKLETAGWWARKYPDDVITYFDGSKGPAPSVACRHYREKACRFLEAMTRHLCEKYPDRFAGIHPAAQNSSEFFYWDTWSKPFFGYDPATKAAFKAWRRKHGRPEAEVPTLAERKLDIFKSPTLADPVKDSVLVDFRLYLQEEMADFVAEVASACRKASGGKKLVIIFYGYQWEFAGHARGAGTSGHYALKYLLDKAAEDLDILCSPISYLDRAWGQTAPAMSAAETVMRHGVMWLFEDDSRTFLDPDKAARKGEGVCMDLAQTRQVLLRNNAQTAIRGFGSWWMDLPACGWYMDTRLWDLMARLGPFDRAILKRVRPFTPEVAAIVDETSMMYLSLGRVSSRFVSVPRAAYGRAGAPYGQYLLSDVLERPLDAKLQIFQSAWYMTPERIATINAQRAAKPDVTRVWCWAPGYLTPGGKDVGGIEALTGFKGKALAPTDGSATATEEGRRRGLPERLAAKDKHPFVDLFGVEATDAETWARFEDGTPAIAVRKNAFGGNEVFLGTPACPPELVRALADLAGVHRYVKAGNAAIWAAEGWLSAMADERGGKVTFDTGVAGPVKDFFTGENIADGPVFTLDMAPGETRLFKFGE